MQTVVKTTIKILSTPTNITTQIRQQGQVASFLISLNMLLNSMIIRYYSLLLVFCPYQDMLVINGVECEPYLTTDHRVMLEQQQDIFTGIRYLLKATGAERAIIGVEANKLDVAEALQAWRPIG